MIYKKNKINKKFARVVLSLFLFAILYFIFSIYPPDVFYKDVEATESLRSFNTGNKLLKEEGIVKFVVDGDTFVMEDGRKVRLIGVDTPEFGERYFNDAKQKMFELVFGKKVMLVRDVSEYDKYGRILRYVYVDGKFVNLEMVEGGYARVLTIPPDVKYSKKFINAQTKARKEKLGIWGE